MLSVSNVSIGVGAVVVVLLWLSLRGPSVFKLINQAIETNDLTDLFAAAEKLGAKQRSYFFQQAIQLLWNGYHRALAARVAKRFATEYFDEKISQYWLQQVQEHEPEIAAQELDDEFLKNYYMPEVAACCGVASS